MSLNSRLSRMTKVLIALLSGIVMGLSVAPVAAFYLAWVALVPLWLLLFSLKNTFKKPTKLALFFNQKTLYAFLWGWGYHGLALFWITGVHPMTWMGVPWLASLAIAIACWIAITFWGAVLVWLWAVGMTLIEQWRTSKKESYQYKLTGIDRALRVLIGVALWCGLESLWSAGPLWWSAIAYTQSPNNLWILQLGQLSGFTTVTAAIIAVNGILAEVLLISSSSLIVVKSHRLSTPPLQRGAGGIQQKGILSLILPLYLISKKYFQQVKLGLLIIPLSVCLSLHLLGFYLYNQPLNDNPAQAFQVGLIQGNIPNTIKLYPEGYAKAIQGYTEGYIKLAQSQVDLVLTPEGALPFYWEEFVKVSPFYQAILQEKTPVLLGAYGGNSKEYTNSLFSIDAQGKLISQFDKVKLVPLGEYVPFSSIIGGLIQRLSPLEGQFVAGNPDQIFMTPLGQATVAICYESAFAGHFRYQTAQGGEFIVTAANNAHYSKAMPAQHHAQDVMRAIESDRWLARATNTGYSAIINPQGKTIWISPIDEYVLHQDTIYRRQTQTLYVRWGDWLTPSLLLLGIVGLMLRQ